MMPSRRVTFAIVLLCAVVGVVQLSAGETVIGFCILGFCALTVLLEGLGVGRGKR